MLFQFSKFSPKLSTYWWDTLYNIGLKLEKQVLRNTYHVVNVLPIVQGNQLKGCKHRPQQIVKTSETVIWIVTNMGQTNISCRTWSKIQTESYYFNIFIQLLKDLDFMTLLIYFCSCRQVILKRTKNQKTHVLVYLILYCCNLRLQLNEKPIVHGCCTRKLVVCTLQQCSSNN